MPATAQRMSSDAWQLQNADLTYFDMICAGELTDIRAEAGSARMHALRIRWPWPTSILTLDEAARVTASPEMEAAEKKKLESLPR